MRPAELKTKIFLDSGDPEETKEALEMLGFLDGQTTNPSLIAKNPSAAGKKFSARDVYGFYKSVVQQVSSLIPEGSVSIEVFADATTMSETMIDQAWEFDQWVPNAHIKFPTTFEGLKAAEIVTQRGMRTNLTLVFSQDQAAAVYAATKSASKDFVLAGNYKQVFVSPFVGRLDDRGENGMDLIKNISAMFQQGDRHVEVLTASVRSLDHFLQAINLGSDIISAPLSVLKEWAQEKFPISNSKFQNTALKPIPYQEISLDKPWKEYNIQHDLTDKGIEKFASDWNSLIE